MNDGITARTTLRVISSAVKLMNFLSLIPWFMFSFISINSSSDILGAIFPVNRGVTPGCQISYTDHTGCHQSLFCLYKIT
jgi:hypothetical protein